jgi:hypothetical protein
LRVELRDILPAAVVGTGLNDVSQARGYIAFSVHSPLL